MESSRDVNASGQSAGDGGLPAGPAPPQPARSTTEATGTTDVGWSVWCCFIVGSSAWISAGVAVTEVGAACPRTRVGIRISHLASPPEDLATFKQIELRVIERAPRSAPARRAFRRPA